LKTHAASPLETVLHAKLQGVHIQGQEILKPLDVSIGGCSLPQTPGSWTALVGPNGAGKSTLLRVLAGLQVAQGEVWLQPHQRLFSNFQDLRKAHSAGRIGDDSTQVRPADHNNAGAFCVSPDRTDPQSPVDAPVRLSRLSARTRAQHIAWLGPQEPGADDLQVQDVVMLGRLPHQGWLAAPTAQDHAAVQRAMQQTQCEEWRHRRLGTLSSGQRQRVLIARTLAVQAPVLLMDEPLAHLDPPHQADWLQTMRSLVAQGTTVVSALHELNMALKADSLLVMAAGAVLHHGTAHAPQTHAALQSAFDHRLRLREVEGEWVALL
jgi:iron complex transport system ATP-binding protein